MIKKELKERLKNCQTLVVFTGAGMSAESGIPTFRDRFEGLWAKYNPEEVATLWAFRENPQFVWDWHVHLAETVCKSQPNPGHYAVARMQDHLSRVAVITQNIDNLHQQAGSREVFELHGSLSRLKPYEDPDLPARLKVDQVICHVCDGYADHEACDPYAAREDFLSIELKAGDVPRCPGCQALLRPDVVWFGEPLDLETQETAFRTADHCDVLICVGSSLEVQPAANIPIRARWGGAAIIEINPEPTSLTFYADAYLQGNAAELLPKLVESVWGR